MTEAEYARQLADLDRLLNDPDVPMQPARVWALLAEIAAFPQATGEPEQPPRSPNGEAGGKSGDSPYQSRPR
jgi:hypothetical protein